MSQVTITGGAGNLGRAVALLLAARGHEVCVFDLPEVDYSFAEGLGNIRVIPGDLTSPPSLAEACRKAEWVIHLAAIMPPLSESRHELARTVNVQGTRNLLAQMPQYAGLVMASSVATYGVAQAEIVGVDHPQRPIDFYGETKLQNERDIRASGRPAAILRISGISVPALLEIPRPWFFTRDQRVEFIHLDDAALAVANCVDNMQVLGRTWQIAGGASWRTTGEGYARAVCEAFDCPPDASTFLDNPNWPAWYDTAESQACLDYQHHSFDDFIAQLRAIYREAIG